jgi:hypothetical protein
MPNLRALLQRTRESLRQAFASSIKSHRMSTPVLFALESSRPLHVVGAKTLDAITPILSAIVKPELLERVARLLERRPAIERLVRLLETQ